MDRTTFSRFLTEVRKQNDYQKFLKLQNYANVADFTVSQREEAEDELDQQLQIFYPRNCHDVDKIGYRMGDEPIYYLDHDRSVSECVFAEEKGMPLPDYIRQTMPRISSWAITYRVKETPAELRHFIGLDGIIPPTKRKEPYALDFTDLIDKRLNELDERITEHEAKIKEVLSQAGTPQRTGEGTPTATPMHTYKTIPTWLYRQLTAVKQKFPYPIKIIRTDMGTVTVEFLGAMQDEIDAILKPIYDKHEEEEFAKASNKRALPNIRDTDTYKALISTLGRRYTAVTSYSPNSPFMGLVSRIASFLRQHQLDYDKMNLDFDLLTRNKRQYTVENAREAFAEFIKSNRLETYLREEAPDESICQKDNVYDNLTQVYALYAIDSEMGLNGKGSELRDDKISMLRECGYEQDDYPQLIRDADDYLKAQSNGEYGATDATNDYIKRYKRDYALSDLS